MLTISAQTEYRKFTEKIALQAGKILVSQKNDFIIKKVKDQQQIDIATSADYASENYLISQINKCYPTHTIMAEESGTNTSQSDFRWIIDPLDGTKEFAKGIPYYYVLIALEYQSKIIASVAYQPETNYMFSADFNTYLNSKKITVSKQTKLDRSFISTRLPSLSNARSLIPKIFAAMNKLCLASYKIRGTQWDAESLAYVALGAYDGFVSFSSKDDRAHYKWWDIAPGILMVRSAGGIVTDVDGNELIEETVSNGLIASNGHIHKKLLQIIKEI